MSSREVGEARSDPRIRKVVETGGRNSGSRRFFALKLVPFQHNVQVTAAATKDLKEKIRNAISNTDEVSIEYIMEAKGAQNVAIPLDDESHYSASGLAGAPGWAILEADMANRRILHRRTIANPYTGKGLREEIRAAVILARQGIDAVILPEPPEERDVSYTLSAYGIRFLFAPATGGHDDMEAILRDATEEPVRTKGVRS